MMERTECRQNKAGVTIDQKKKRMVMTMDTQRDARIARALQIRLAQILKELHSCERQRVQAYELADNMLDEFDRLAKERFFLTRALWRVQDRLSRAAFNRQDREEVAA